MATWNHGGLISSHFFRVTDPLCWEFTGHRWITITKASDAELWCFLWAAPEQRLSKQSRLSWFGTPSRSLWCLCSEFDLSKICVLKSRLQNGAHFVFKPQCVNTNDSWNNVDVLKGLQVLGMYTASWIKNRNYDFYRPFCIIHYKSTITMASRERRGASNHWQGYCISIRWFGLKTLEKWKLPIAGLLWWESYQWLVDSHHKGPIMWKDFPCHDNFKYCIIYYVHNPWPVHILITPGEQFRGAVY